MRLFHSLVLTTLATVGGVGCALTFSEPTLRDVSAASALLSTACASRLAFNNSEVWKLTKIALSGYIYYTLRSGGSGNGGSGNGGSGY